MSESQTAKLLPKCNLLGRELTTDEQVLWHLYEDLKLLSSRTDFPPFVNANLKSALAHLWQVINGLDIDFEFLEEDLL